MPLACDMSVPLYITVGCSLLAAKLWVAYQHTRTWMERQRKFAKRFQGKRLPFVPTLSWYLFICYIPFFTLTFLNIANKDNGTPTSLFGCGWIGIGLLCMFYLFKFVSLGKKIVRQARPNGMRTQSRDAAGDDTEVDTVTTFDFAGKLGVVLCIIALTGQSICFVLLPPIFPHDDMILRIGFGFQAWFILQHFIAIMHHFQRVKNAVIESFKANQNIVSAPKDLKVVLRKLREQQASLVFVEIVCVTFIVVVTAGGLRITWWVLILFMIFETLNFAIIALSNMKGFKKKRIPIPAPLKKRSRVDADKSKASAEEDGKKMVVGNVYVSTVGGDVEVFSTSVTPQQATPGATVHHQHKDPDPIEERGETDER